MKITGFIRLVVFSCVLGLVAPGPSAQGPPPDPGNKPKVEFDEEATPLQKGVQAAIEARKERERGNPANNGRCNRAIEEDNAEDIAKFCKVPKLEMKKLGPGECGDCGDILNPAGKRIGKRVRTETELVYDEPGQRGIPNENGQGRWKKVMVKRQQLGQAGNGVSNRGLGRGNGPRTRNAVLFSEHAINDDKDCVDAVTGEHLGGLIGGQIPMDGDPASCFDASGALKMTLELAPGGCRHIASGTLLEGDMTDSLEDACFDESNNLKTSLEESVDEDPFDVIDDDNDGLFSEDPPGNGNEDNDCIDKTGTVYRDAGCFDAAGNLFEGLAELIDEDGDDEIDQDLDGVANEDPPAQDPTPGCRDFGSRAKGLPPGLGDMMAGGECDLSRAMTVAMNREAMQRLGGKIFMADDQGNFDASVGADLDSDGQMDSIEFGLEKRKVKLFETFTVKCEDPQAELIDGQCVAPPAAAEAALAIDSQSSTKGIVRGQERWVDNGDGTRTLKQYMMMGFTFAPPVAEWGYRVEEYACVDLLFGEICFEVFFARLGYEFDFALGLRLPVEVEVADIPTDAVLAGQELMLNTTITPVDFTAKQYEQFCEDNDLADGLLISDCERFSFPNFFDTINPLTPPDEVDGDEFVAHEVVFAGLIVRVVGVPIIQWGIDSAVDLPTMCSLIQTQAKGFDLVQFGSDLLSDKSVIEALKNQLINCGSFTTPFGTEQDPLGLPGVQRLRAFPFTASYSIGADCLQALVEGKTVTINKKTYPICTNMILGVNGASLGIGLGLQASAGSTLVTADWEVEGDSAPNTGGGETEVRYRHEPASGPNEPFVGPIVVDNFDDSPLQDQAIVKLDDFVYYLNALQLGLTANFEFGGILSPIPDLGGFTIFNLIIDGNNNGIPIGQHSGTEGIEIPIDVRNYGLDVGVRADATTPAQVVDDKTLRIKPGEFGSYEVHVDNLGSFPGAFDNFARQFSNEPDPSMPFTFVVNQNTDFDCTDGGGQIYRGFPYDGVADDCYDATGTVRTDRTELINEDPLGPAGALQSIRDEDGDGSADEDPVDEWKSLPDATAWGQETIVGVPAHQISAAPLVLSVSPFRHPLTAPGDYAFRVTADSVEAKAFGLAATDPSGNARIGASDVAFIRVESFFEPKVAIEPAVRSAKPGVLQQYSLEGSNQANVEDSVILDISLPDSNLIGCGLATLGSDPSCPYRAVPTAIPAAEWTDLGQLPGQYGPLQPLEAGQDTFGIGAPREWAGMQDTVYQVVIKGTSGSDPADPAASDFVVVEQTVQVTMESMTRYVKLEVDELIAEIQAANDAGISTGGLEPILVRPATSHVTTALEAILAGDLGNAARSHRNAIQIIDAFLHALDGGGGNLPAQTAQDWRLRAEAIRADLVLAEASPIPSAPAQ